MRAMTVHQWHSHTRVEQKYSQTLLETFWLHDRPVGRKFEMVRPYYSAKYAHNVLGHAYLPSPQHAYPSSRMLLLSPFWNRCHRVLTIRLQQLQSRLRHYCMRSLFSYLPARSIVSVVSQNLRFEGDFPQETKCAFLQPQQKSCGWQLSSEVPSSVATFRATIEQPTKAHTAILRG